MLSRLHFIAVGTWVSLHDLSFNSQTTVSVCRLKLVFFILHNKGNQNGVLKNFLALVLVNYYHDDDAVALFFRNYEHINVNE